MQGGMRLQAQFSRREDLLRHLEAVLEIPHGTLSESIDFSSVGSSRGLSAEAFEALPKVRFEAPRPGAEALAGLPVGDLKRLMEAHCVPDAGCIEKAHLVEALLEAFARPRPPASLSLRSIAQPSQCAICMSAFKEGDLLRQLSCSELHVFCNGCIQQWLDKNTSCPMCRTECGPPASPAPPEPSPTLLGRELGPSIFGLGSMLGGAMGSDMGSGPGGAQPIGMMASIGGPEHTFLLLDAPMGLNLGNLGNLGLHSPHGAFSGSAGRAFSRSASRGASRGASPAAPAPMRDVGSSERAGGGPLPSRPGRRVAPWGGPSRPGSAGIRLPPMQRSSRAAASAEPERPPARSPGRSPARPPGSPGSQGASSSSSSVPPPTPPPPPTGPANPRRSFLPSLRSVAGVLPRLSSTSARPRSNNATPITGAGTSLSAAGSGRSFAARTRAMTARRRSSGDDEDCVVL